MAPRRREDASAALEALGVNLESATLSKDAIVKLLKARAAAPATRAVTQRMTARAWLSPRRRR